MSSGAIGLAPSSFYTDTSTGKDTNPADLGQYWAFKQMTGLAPFPGAAVYGIGSAGFGIFGPQNTFLPSSGNLVVNADYGLVSGVGENGDSGLNSPLIQNGADIVLNGFTPGDMITNVSFQFGTTAQDANLPGSVTPTPNSFVVGAGALVFGLIWIRRENRRRQPMV
ncbi:MAG: hypothetical protein M1330_00515 [Armatimonadetes bacterium]|nr:hypothetical protein [Armatimonadota bacterium]